MAQSSSGMQDQMKDKVQDLAGQASEQVQGAKGQAQKQVASQVDQRSTQLGEQIGSTADDLRSVAKELRNSDKEQPAKLADQVAERAEQVSDYLRRSDGQTILSDVEDFGRRQPWAVVACGIAIGFLASRFLKSSSTNRYRSGSSSLPSSTGRGLEYDGPRDVDIPSSTYIPPVDDATLPAPSPSAADAVRGAGAAPGAVTGTTAFGTVETAPGANAENRPGSGSSGS